MGALTDHMASGATTVCRCWALTRGDGVMLGFTDHDRDLSFDGSLFRAATGVTAQVLEKSTGLSVDNTEALGVLSDSALSEDEIAAGRFDGAEIVIWDVNWADPEMRELRFRGTLGEIARTEGAFRAELRGLSEALNVPQGRVYQRACSAVLGDAACGVDLELPGFFAEVEVTAQTDGRTYTVAGAESYAERWFQHGVLTVLDGAAEGLSSGIQGDDALVAGRSIALNQELRAPLMAGDRVRLVAGCDKRAETCREKFDNFLNFRGFPHIPGEDWQVSYPRSDGDNDGGSLS